MSCPVNLRILFGGDDDSRKLTLTSIPASVEELVLEIKTAFGLREEFRVQYRDVEFGNEFMNLMETSEIQDKSTLKLIFVSCYDTLSSIPGTSRSLTSVSCANSPCESHLQDQDYISNSSSDTIVLNFIPLESLEPSPPGEFTSFLAEEHMSSSPVELMSSPESRTYSWPVVFTVPQFSYSAEIQLQQANTEFSTSATLLIPPPKLRSDILQGMAEEIVRYTAYASDRQLEEAAAALVKAHPYLSERGMRNGHEGWKYYLKIKMANFRTKLGRLGHPEVSVNSLKNKLKGQGKAAANIKKPRKAEVNFLPSLPKGATTASLEEERVALLTEVKKKNNEAVIKDKMHQTFSYRRLEVVQDMPMVAEFQNRWPALFTMSEVSKGNIKEQFKSFSFSVLNSTSYS